MWYKISPVGSLD